MLRHACVLGLSVTAMVAGWPHPVLAAPVVNVAAPKIMRLVGCRAPVAVAVTLSAVTPGIRYEASGEILEEDDWDGEDDYCCTLNPQETPPGEPPYALLLTRKVLATDLGLQRGHGPASDELSYPERVALYARVWVRDLASGDRFGPWESPRLIVVSNPRLLWAPPEGLPGREFMTPSGRNSARQPLPPQACVP
jgi:hypothetical protein